MNMKKYLLPLLGIALIASNAFAFYYPTGGSTYTLQSSIGSADTSLTLASFKEPVSNIPYTMTYLNSSIECATIDPQTTHSEFVSFTGITQNTNGSATITGLQRGLGRSYPYTASSTLASSHSGQAQFILSDSPCLFTQYAIKQNNETITGNWTFTNGIGGTVSTSSPNTWSALQQFNGNASTTILSVNGPLSVGTTSTTTIYGNATSSFSGGINLINGGCFAKNGVCNTFITAVANTWTAIQTFGSHILAATRPEITTSIDDANGNPIIGLSPVGSAVNYPLIINAVAGSPSTITGASIESAAGSGLILASNSFAGTAGVLSLRVNNIRVFETNPNIDPSLTYETYFTAYPGNDTGTGSPDPATLSVGSSQTDASFDVNAKGAGNILFRTIGTGNVSIGTTTPVANFSVTNGTATTTLQIGSAAATKGSCIKLYRTDGSAIYAYVLAGATTFTLSTVACATISGF